MEKNIGIFENYLQITNTGPGIFDHIKRMIRRQKVFIFSGFSVSNKINTYTEPS